MNNTKRRLAVVTAIAALVLTACGRSHASETDAVAFIDLSPLSEVSALENPKEYQGPSTAVISSAVVNPVTENPQQTLPATITSHDAAGAVQVEITDTSRVIGLDMAGSIAATVVGLGFGDSLVGRDVSTTFPGAEELPVVTSNGHSVNIEAIIAQDPTLIITDGSIGPRKAIEQLRDVGISVVFVENEPSFDGAANLARNVAAAFGATEAGEALAAEIENSVASKIAEIEAIAPTGDDRLGMMFLYIRGASGIYYLFGSESGADRLITGLGGIDVAGELGWEGMKPLTDEAMVDANPDLILVMSDGIASAGGVDGLLESKPAIALTNAGQNRRIVDMADGQILSFGPRSAAILDALARAIYAPEESQP